MRGKRWTVYILRCADGSLYTGITSDAARRMAQHRCGHGSKYVASRLPFVPVWNEPAKSRSAALRREAAIKSMPRSRKLALVGAGKVVP